jgi:xylulokinase
VPAGAGGILFLPYLSGERTPHADPDARGAFVGLSASHTRGHILRAVLEGVAFGLADSFDLLRSLGVEATVARASGGGARSDLWLRICASVLGVPVVRMSVDEGSAFGAALLGGIAGGMFADADEAVTACVRVRDQIDPEPAWVALASERRARFRALYPALKGVLG